MPTFISLSAIAVPHLKSSASGAGKSSVVKAGLLPRLSQDVIALYIEATPDDTELRFLLSRAYGELGDVVNSLGGAADWRKRSNGWSALRLHPAALGRPLLLRRLLGSLFFRGLSFGQAHALE